MKNWFFLLFFFGLMGIACRPQNVPPPTLFSDVSADSTHVLFSNTLKETERWNLVQYLYFYNGAGVATADFDNDGKCDLFFVANMGESKLYRNKGNLQFEDVSQKANIGGAQNDWKTGVTVVDINADGWLDLYVCAVSGTLRPGLTLKGKNQLFVNNHDGTFTDRAAEYGLDATGLCTQAAFFDYDGDGDLDCYLLRHSVHSARSYRPVSARMDDDPMSSDVLYRNFGGNRFADVSKEANIHDGSLGYGLGLAVGDLNGDGLPDIWVGNDFHDNDYVYLNTGNGKFSEQSNRVTGHNSNFSMGNDLADINNDGRLDYFGLDMKPEGEPTLKASEGANNYSIYDLKHREFGYHFQFPRNTLQINMGNLLDNNKTPFFQDIAQYAGVATTDWSWAGLMADLDRDGWKDLYVCNRIRRRPNDLDFMKFSSNQEVQAQASDLQLVEKMPDGKAANYAYRNRKDLTFEDVSAAWGLQQTGYSNGAAYADLDNDGDLDLVVNNLNAPASVYRNNANVLQKNKNHFLELQLAGNAENTLGIGAKVTIFDKNNRQMLEQSPTRGFLSAVSPVLFFGCGETQMLDSLQIIWRDGKKQTLRSVRTDQLLTLRQSEAKEKNLPTVAAKSLIFKDITAQSGVKWAHQENEVNDTDKEKLIPHFLSTEGPALAVGDVNGDGLDDFFVGGAYKQHGQLFLGQKNGSFLPTEAKNFPTDLIFEIVGAALFDADGDQDLDLYLVAGGWQVNENDVLLLNDGKGKFTRAFGALPELPHIGSCVRVADIDDDDDLDLFVGSRAVAGEYGISPQSYILENDGLGRFTVVDSAFAPQLDRIGMVTDAVWTDLNGDRKPELVVVGEFMPVSIFYHRGDHMERVQLEHTSGWWRSITAADMDNDGDADLLLGNWGLNSNLHATMTEPIGLYVKDFDRNGDLDPVLTYFRAGKNYCYNSKDELVGQMPILKKRYVEYKKFSTETFDDVFNAAFLKGAMVKKAYQMASVYIENKDNGEYEVRPLPAGAQLSTVERIVTADFDHDGKLDALVGGNFYEVAPSIGRMDASVGALLKGDGKGHFTALSPTESGLVLQGAVRDLRVIGNQKLLVAVNNAPIQVIDFALPNAKVVVNTVVKAKKGNLNRKRKP